MAKTPKKPETSPPPAAPTGLAIMLGGKSYAAEIPARYADRRELATTWVRSNLRGAAALLAYCCPGLGLRRTTANPAGLDINAFGCNWFDFGAEALELLMAGGASEFEIIEQSVTIFNAIAVKLPPAPSEVREARNFSKATADSTTGPSS